jgi:hypothetical protein
MSLLAGAQISAPLRWGIWTMLAAGAVVGFMRLGEDDRRSTTGIAVSSSSRQVTDQPTGDAKGFAAFLAALRRTPESGNVNGEPFAGQSRARTAEPAAAPSAPPFPFKYAGRLEMGSGPATIYLVRGNDVVPVKAGDVLDGFRVDALSEDRIELTFVASGQRFSMLLSSLTGEGGGPAGGNPPAAPGSPAFPGASNPPSGAPAAQTAAQGGPSMQGVAAPLASSVSGISQTAPSGSSAPGIVSTPTSPAAAPSGVFPAGPTPTGKLGTDPASGGKLGTDSTKGGKLGN